MRVKYGVSGIIHSLPLELPASAWPHWCLSIEFLAKWKVSGDSQLVSGKVLGWQRLCEHLAAYLRALQRVFCCPPLWKPVVLSWWPSPSPWSNLR